jgi:hypothetical protein
MKITLPPIPASLRETRWRLRDPALSDLPASPRDTLAMWTAAPVSSTRTEQHWPAHWSFEASRVTMIYELHMFVSIATVENVGGEQLDQVLSILCAAEVELHASVALADLL